MSAGVPTDKFPSSSPFDLTRRSMFERRTTSSSVIPILRNFDMVVSMVCMAPFMLPMCRSVDIESGRNPCFTAGTAQSK